MSRFQSLPILVRLLLAAGFAVAVVTAGLVLVVRDRIEAAMYDEAKQQVLHANSLMVYLSRQKGAPAIKDDKVVFGDWAPEGDHSVVDLVTEKSGAAAT